MGGQVPAVRAAHVSHSAIEGNLRQILGGRVEYLADLRANAFGHGVIPAAHAHVDAGAQMIGVGHEMDAAALRSAGIQIPVVVFSAEQCAVPSAEVAGLPRVGAEAFGLSEVPGAVDDRLVPAMTLRAPILGIKAADAGAGVSYGYTYRTSRATRLALVPIGYGDGIDRSVGNTARVWAGGQSLTIAGRVAMDACVLDIGELPLQVGDPVTFFGDPATGVPHPAEWAVILGVPSATVTSCLTARLERLWHP